MPPKRSATTTSKAASKRTKKGTETATENPVVTSGKAVLTSYAASKIAQTPIFDSGDDADKGSPSDVSLSTNQIADLVAYCYHLEHQVSQTEVPASPTKSMTEAEIQNEANKLCGVIGRGIQKLMKWKLSCKTNSATFSFEGMCNSPEIMARVLKVSDATQFKMKKLNHEDIEDIFGGLYGSTRFRTLHVVGNVTFRWNPDHKSGVYKFGGKYGLGSGL